MMKEQCHVKRSQRRLLVALLCVVLLLSSAGRTHALLPSVDTIMLENDENATTAAPTPANTTVSPSPTTSFAPTMAPTNATENVTTAVPTTVAPTVANTSSPTIAPTASPGTSVPTTTPPVTTDSPTATPTYMPSSGGDTKHPSSGHHFSFFRFVEKTVAYLILLVLALLGFGAFMANRYRIYFFLRGVWYTILQMDCTLWLIRKLRLSDYFGYQPVDTTLNSSLFENELNEGLLMRETDT